MSETAAQDSGLWANIYVRQNGKVRPVKNLSEAAEAWMDDNQLELYETDTIRVSTVFIPLMMPSNCLYETLADNLSCSNRTWRYATESEARANHDRIVQLLESGTRLSEID